MCNLITKANALKSFFIYNNILSESLLGYIRYKTLSEFLFWVSVNKLYNISFDLMFKNTAIQISLYISSLWNVRCAINTLMDTSVGVIPAITHHIIYKCIALFSQACSIRFENMKANQDINNISSV